MSKVDIWMPLYIADYLADTSRLTTEQHGAYLLLLIDYWRNGSLPDDDAVLAQITRLSPDAWRNARSILQAYFKHEGGRWLHNRVEVELAKAKQNSEMTKTRASNASKVRWGKKNDAQSNARSITQAMPEDMLEQSPSPSPSKYIKPPIPPKGGNAISLDTFLKKCKEEGKRAIPEGHAVFAYAEKAGIPHEFLKLHWLEFKDRYSHEDSKRYKAWPTVFLKSVRGNWFKLWYAADGGYALTTVGLQAKKLHKETA